MAQTPIPPYAENLLLAQNSKISNVWLRFFQTQYKQQGGQSGQDVYPVFYIEATIAYSDIASNASFTLVNAVTDAASFKIRDIMLSGDGTDFSGGDRNLAIQDESGTRIYTIVPSSTLSSLDTARWGDSAVPYPTTAADLLGASTVGESIVATYSGGSSDYSAGSLTILLVLEKVA